MDDITNRQKVPNSERVAELWMAIKLLLAGKVDVKELENYSTVDATVTAITMALQSYPTDIEMRVAISTALSNYMTTSEVNDAILQAISSISTMHYVLVDELPEVGDEDAIYLVSNGNEDDENADDFYDEYYYYDGKWNRIGSTNVDLSNYWSKDELQIMTQEELEAILNDEDVLDS